MCVLHASNNGNDKLTDATNVFGGRPIPDDPTTFSLVFLCVGINFIYTWLNVFANNSAYGYCVYQEKMKEIFKQILTQIPKPTPEYFKTNVRHLWLILEVNGI